MTHRKNQPIVEGVQSVPNRTRRSLLNTLWLGLGGLAVAETAWLVGVFMKSSPSGGTPVANADIIDAGPASRFMPNTVTAFPRGRFYLACMEDGGFLALSRRCTHLGCTVPWDAQKLQFACPCHASVFNIRGEVIRSPAPRPLDHFDVTVENGRIKVAMGRPIRRSAFHPDQVVYQ